MSVVSVEVGSCVYFYQTFCLFIVCCVNGWFWRTALSGCFYIKYTFSFNLTWEESFLKSTARRLTFDKYLVLHQLFIKYQLYLGSPEGFPSSMANLVMQYFYNFYNFGLFSRWFFDSVILTFSFCLFIKLVCNFWCLCKLFIKCFSDTHCWKLFKTTEMFVRNENEMFK